MYKRNPFLKHGFASGLFQISSCMRKIVRKKYSKTTRFTIALEAAVNGCAVTADEGRRGRLLRILTAHFVRQVS
jgi:hypothetical protein